jgi:serine/threonine protein kinase/Tol biopolymer transport system component
MGLISGTKLGPYEIASPLGAGGMGEVYRARDMRLGREVAIKVLPSHLSSDPNLKTRFEREAKAISALSHPHICHLYDIGSQDGTDYLVMELLEGETLADRLRKGPLPLRQALQYGIEIAEALEKAHSNGIVHRDLKPGNVILTKSGAKLLDFGLAKPSPNVANMASGSMATMSKPLTMEGTIVGTFQYMAPEQVQGHEADARSDLFALGAVLYEMMTGKRAFAGKSQISVMSAILEKEPEPVSTKQPLVPPALDHVIQRALAKDPDDRWQTARDLRQELKWSAESAAFPSGAVPAAARSGKRETLAWLMWGALAILLISGAILWRNAKPPSESMYFPAPLPFPAKDIAIAPNGHTIALAGYQESARKNVLWIYELGSHGARSLAGTEGASYPFWSPDGRSLGFFADAQMKKVEVAGGPVQTICDAPSGRGGTWNKDGVIVFAPIVTAGLYRVPASGGTPTQISDIDKGRGVSGLRWPVFLPDGKHFLYLAANFTGQKGANVIYVGSLDSKEQHFVVESTANAAYAAQGYLLFYKDKTLLAQPFDLKRFALTGEPTVLLPDVQFLPQVKRAVFAVSDQGLLLAQSGSEATLSQLTWFDRKGNAVGSVGKPEVYGNVFLSPNGKSVAIDKTDMSSLNIDVWTYELQSDSAKRLTFDPGIDSVPVWSPDAARLVFSSNRQIYFGLYLKNSDGATDEKSIVQQDDVGNFPSDWSRDGKYILYCRGSDLGLLTLPELKSSLFLKAPSVLRNAQFSPDGKWVAYASNESGKWEIYVTSFPDARGRWQISSGGGEQPRWRGDGKELFYLSLDGKMMAAAVTTGTHFDVGTPILLFQSTPRQPVLVYDLFVYDVSRDGHRFLINTQVKQGDSAPMSVILNWPAKLGK